MWSGGKARGVTAPEAHLSLFGKVPEFDKKLATCRKYEIGVSVILQSLTQLQRMYEKNWSELAGNCDTTIYLGGGPDTVTTKWLSELLGKETKVVMNTTFSGKNGGSMSLNRQGVELLTPAQARTLGKMECIVVPKSQYGYRGEKYPTLDHPNWKSVINAGIYMWSDEKNRRLNNATEKPKPAEEMPETPPAPTMAEEERKDEANREARQRATEFASNRDAEGNPVVEDPRPIGGENTEFTGQVAVSGDLGAMLREEQDTFNRNELLWKLMEQANLITYGSAPAEEYSSSA